jgi:Flp pilus assembly protein TadG
MVETSLALLIFFSLVAFVFDYGILLYRHSQLVDIASQALQETIRDPAANSKDNLRGILAATFDALSKRRLGGETGAAITEVAFVADAAAAGSTMCRTVTVVAEWEATCMFCWAENFRQRLRASSTATLENPEFFSLVSGGC